MKSSIVTNEVHDHGGTSRTLSRTATQTCGMRGNPAAQSTSHIIICSNLCYLLSET
jgi:hypothetical protein